MTKRISLSRSTANFNWSWCCWEVYDRVLAGYCWEVHTTRVTPSESLLSLHQVAKCLTMQLAVYLAAEVAAILRAVLTHTKKLYNDGTVHLLC